MSFKLYRKAFAGVALAASMLLSSFVNGAIASTGDRSLTVESAELLQNDTTTSASSPEALAIQQEVAYPESLNIANAVPVDGLLYEETISASNLIAAPATPSPTFSQSARLLMPEAAELLQNDNASLSVPDEALVAQEGGVEIVPEVNDTFAPLSDDELREQLLIDPNFAPSAPRPAPGSSFLTPSAYGADWGDAFVGVSGVTSGRTDSKWDGSIGAGVGFGDAVENVGVEVSVGIISLDGFGEDGTIGVKIHKVFPEADNLAVALGWSNAVKWGAAGRAEDTFSQLSQ